MINPVTMSDLFELSKNNDKYFDKIQEYNSKIDHSLIISTNNENQYYQKITKLAKDMRNFHNWIKSTIIYTYCHPNFKNNKSQSVLDIGCGKGGDLLKFYMGEIDYYVGIDYDYNNIINPVDGALSRYNQMKKTKAGVPKMIFIQSDARVLFSYNDQKRALTNMTTQNRKLLQEYFPEKNKSLFDIINSSFAIHYMFENDITFSNLKTNINNHLRNNGYVLLTTFNGELIRKLLKGKEKYTEYYTDEESNKKILFEIVKKFNDSDPIGTGVKIDVFNSWFNKENEYYSEYLVDKEFIVNQFDIDCNLELVDFDYFKNQFEIHREYIVEKSKFKSDEETRKYLTSVRKYYNETDFNKACYSNTNLNCYYIFKKRSTLPKQSGGDNINSQEYDFSNIDNFYIPNMNTYNNNNSFMNSIHQVLHTHNVIPNTLKVNRLYNDFGLSVIPDSNIDNKMMKKICKSFVINHDVNGKSKKILNGLNIINVERDCNDHYDINYITRTQKQTKNDKYIILMKEGQLYKPIYKKQNTDNLGLYNNNDDIIQYLIENGEKI